MSGAPVDREKIVDFKAKSGLRDRALGQSVTFRVSPELVAMIKLLAELTGDKNLSRVVNRLLVEGLKDF